MIESAPLTGVDETYRAKFKKNQNKMKNMTKLQMSSTALGTQGDPEMQSWGQDQSRRLAGRRAGKQPRQGWFSVSEVTEQDGPEQGVRLTQDSQQSINSETRGWLCKSSHTPVLLIIKAKIPNKILANQQCIKTSYHDNVGLKNVKWFNIRVSNQVPTKLT